MAKRAGQPKCDRAEHAPQRMGWPTRLIRTSVGRVQARFLRWQLHWGEARLALAVGVIIDVDGGGAGQRDGGRAGGPPAHRVVDQEQGGRGVDRRHPDQAAPAQVVAGAVVRNVHGAPVARLPPGTPQKILYWANRTPWFMLCLMWHAQRDSGLETHACMSEGACAPVCRKQHWQSCGAHRKNLKM